MAATEVQSKALAVNTATATNSVSWDTPATAGNLLVIIVCSDDYITAGNRPSGYTFSTGMGQETNCGHYLFWKVAAGGETSSAYTLNGAATSCWLTLEVDGLDASPYDTSNGQNGAPTVYAYTTPAITPSSGERYLLASIGAANSVTSMTGLGTWLNSHIEIRDACNTLGSGTRDGVGMASRSVTGNGSTTFSSGASVAATNTPDVMTGLLIAFKISTVTEEPPLTLRLEEPELYSVDFE